ncbi:MAG: RNA-binding protein [Bacteroidia bacterium]|nr:MAG: RNA-binding protein [Bacteroidia bacterium]
MSSERIDKFLWSVRLFKTRSQAAEACKKNRVYIHDNPAKPSKLIAKNDVFKIKHPPVYRVYKVKEVLHNRVSAALVKTYLEEITPQEDLDTLYVVRQNTSLNRKKGLGRPTKKDRRDLNKLLK